MTPEELNLVEELNLRIEVIEAQRATALTWHVEHAAKLKMARATIATMQRTIDDLTTSVEVRDERLQQLTNENTALKAVAPAITVN